LGILDQRVAELAEAQRRTEERVAELAEAQQRTDQRVAELAEAQRRTEERVAELAEAQRRTEEQLGILDQRVAELAEAQQRTDQRVAELAEAQRRTEERLDVLDQRVTELAEAQQRTDESLARLSQVVEIGFRELGQAVGNLANRFGFDLEEFVAALLPPYLEKHLGISRLGLERRYFELSNGQIEEVDLAGRGQQAGKPVMVLVECRTTIRGSEAQKVVNKLQAIRATLKGEVEMVIVAMNIHPTAKAVGEAGGVRMVPYSRINRPGDFAE
jgi:prefoldin subunit 5